jgi:hypothetical protein
MRPSGEQYHNCLPRKKRRYAEIASVARYERERPVERAIFSRRFFSAFRTRMVMVAVRGVSIMSYIVSHAVQRAMKEGSGGFHAA